MIVFYFFLGHPTIFYQLLQQKGIEFHTLKHYINHRDEVFQDIIKSKYEDWADETKYKQRVSYVKQEIISCLNGGSYLDAFTNNQWWVNFFGETKDMLSIIYDKYIKDLPYYTFLKYHKNDKSRNKLGSAISYFLQSKENEILYYMLDYLNSRKFEVSALSFDGLMINKDISKPINDNILEMMSNYVFEKTNFRIQIIIKPQEQGFNIDAEFVDDIDIHNPNILQAPIDYDNPNEIVRLLSLKQLGQSQLVHHHFKDKVIFFLYSLYVFILLIFHLFLFRYYILTLSKHLFTGGILKLCFGIRFPMK
tara:strand:- start:436 stop:1356 length:921 start_codon:yes stop_codon:yes gene_type:complete